MRLPVLVCIAMGWALPAIGQGRTGIRPSPSGHYVTYRGRTTMLIGDSGTQVVPMNGDLDLSAWLDTCRREGHSTVHVWAFTGAKPGDWRLGSRAPLLPWVRKPDGMFDLHTFDEGKDPRRHYWARIRELCSQARRSGLLVGITVLFGWAKDHGPSPGWLHHPFNVSMGGIATRSSDIVEPADRNEIGAERWDDGWPPSRKAQWLWERFALKLIGETRPFDNVWFDYRDEWSYLNPEAARAEAFWRRFFTSRGAIWADRSGKGGLRVENPDVPDLGATPAIKTEGPPYEHDAVRSEVWRLALSGIHYLLHNDAREPNVAAWDPGIARSKGISPSDDAGRRYIGICSIFFNREVRDLDSLVPPSSPMDGRTRSLAGKADIVAMVPAGETEVVLNVKDYGPVERVRILDPKSGSLTEVKPRRSGDTLTVPIGPNGHGAVVHVLARMRHRRIDSPAPVVE